MNTRADRIAKARTLALYVRDEDVLNAPPKEAMLDLVAATRYSCRRIGEILNVLVLTGGWEPSPRVLLADENMPTTSELVEWNCKLLVSEQYEGAEEDVVIEEADIRRMLEASDRVEDLYCAWKRAFNACNENDVTYEQFRSDFRERVIADAKGESEPAKRMLYRLILVEDVDKDVLGDQELFCDTKVVDDELEEYVVPIITDLLGIDIMAQALADGVPRGFI